MSRAHPMIQRLLVATGRPALEAGLRAAVLTTIPALLGVALGRPTLTWIGLAAWLVGIADVGGAYATRAAVMASVTALGAAGGLFASLAAGPLWTAVPFMFVAGTGSSLLRVLGSNAATAGSLVLVIIAISLGAPASGVHDALARTGLHLTGGALAMVVALAFWRIYPYKPAREAAARCWSALAEVTGELRRLVRDGAPVAAWDEWIRRTPRALRQAIQAARAALVATRVGRPAESPLGEQLHVLVEAADREFADVIALAPALEQGGPHQHADQDAALAERQARFARVAADILEWRDVTLDEAARPAVAFAPPDLGAWTRARLTSLRAQLTLESSAFRHGLRVGVAGAASVVATRLLGIEHGTWVTLTAVTILQPSIGATRARALQRLAGTVLGGALAGLISAAGSPYLTVAALAAAVFAARASLPMSYTYFSVFVTPAFVLFAELTQHAGHLTLVRIADTFVGGVMALVAIYALWPPRGRDDLRRDLAHALECARRLLLAVFAGVIDGQRDDDAALAAARREVGLANTAAEDAFQRLLDEGGAGEEEREEIYTLTTYSRRLSAAVVGAIAHRDALEQPALRARLAPFVAAAERELAELAAALREGRPCAPADIAAPDVTGAEPALGARLERTGHALIAIGAAARRAAALTGTR